MVPVACIVTAVTFVTTFHMRCTCIVRYYYYYYYYYYVSYTIYYSFKDAVLDQTL
jgi:hypothetical protein